MPRNRPLYFVEKSQEASAIDDSGGDYEIIAMRMNWRTDANREENSEKRAKNQLFFIFIEC